MSYEAYTLTFENSDRELIISEEETPELVSAFSEIADMIQRVMCSLMYQPFCVSVVEEVLSPVKDLVDCLNSGLFSKYDFYAEVVYFPNFECSVSAIKGGLKFYDRKLYTGQQITCKEIIQ